MKEVAREIGNVGMAVRSGQPGGGMIGVTTASGVTAGTFQQAIGNNFVTNAAAKAGMDFGKDVAAGVLGDLAKYGTNFGGSFSGSVTSNVLRAGSNLPIVGDVINEVVAPLDTARNRVKAIATDIARAGGEADSADMKDLAKRFLGEETRAFQAGKKVDLLFRDQDLIDQAVNSSPQFQSGVEAVDEALNQLAPAIKAVIDYIMDHLRNAETGPRMGPSMYNPTAFQ